jgi:hypothetical protein
MFIDEIISQIDEGGPGSYYYFETFIHHLFKHHIESQNKTFLIPNEHSRLGNATAPEGFDAFEGSTLIEIKFSLAADPVRIFLQKLTHQYSSEYAVHKYSNLLVISAKPIPEKMISKYRGELEHLQLPFNVIFWGPHELNKIASKHKKIVNSITDNIFALRLESAISQPSRDWKQERKEIIETLRESYKKGQFSLFLGGGISSSAGMPDWKTLLNSLFVAYLTEEFDGDVAINDRDISKMVNRLNSIDEPSALMAARYLRKGLSRRDSEAQEFIDAITESLYKLRDTHFDIASKLIRSIASMCIGAEVKSIVTYNFDDLLERELAKKEIHFHSIYTDNESYDTDELPIYHVHGFLPEDREAYDGLENTTLVFSEEGFHKIYSDSYHWSNLVQLNSLRENTCLMVGLSMTDPDLRRLLDISSKHIEKSKHFAFMKRLSVNDFCYEHNGKHKSKEVDNLAAAKKFLDRHHTLNEELMKELGVTVVWYESYDDIPGIIQKIAAYETS